MAVGRRGTPQQVGQTVDVGEVQPGAVVGHAGTVGRPRSSEAVDGVRVRISPVRRPGSPSPVVSSDWSQAVTVAVDQTWSLSLTAGAVRLFPDPGQPPPAPRPSRALSPHLGAGVPRVPAGADRRGDGADTELRGRSVEVTRAESATEKQSI